MEAGTTVEQKPYTDLTFMFFVPISSNFHVNPGFSTENSLIAPILQLAFRNITGRAQVVTTAFAMFMFSQIRSQEEEKLQRNHGNLQPSRALRDQFG
jgi:hypothetical protein